MSARYRRALGAILLATAALVVALVLAGAERGLALYAYVLFLGVVAAVLLVRRIGTALPRTPKFERLARRPRQEPDDSVPQLESLARQLAAGRSTTLELHVYLRPLVTQIAGAQLARRHGVDLERTPDRGRALLGPRTWELVRPERQRPEERFERGWTTQELRELVGELERI